MAIPGLLRLAVLEDDGARDRVRTLCVGDVEAGHQPWDDLEPELVLEIIEYLLRSIRRVLEGRDAVLHGMSRVRAGKFDEPQLFPRVGAGGT